MKNGVYQSMQKLEALEWAGYVVRMEEGRTPKKFLNRRMH